MERNRHIRVPREASRVLVREPGDVRYWCDKWRCTEAQLLEAVRQVGPLPSNVEAYLRQRAAGGGLENLDWPRGRRPS
ncbi:MAG TPA: DUF3606 domain-containing protein [Usitatibacter sp.]|nr:DUF3606 domain-containing protein [Usitatibacter sp.]